MVSGDVIQRFDGRLDDPEIRVWDHRTPGDDEYIVLTAPPEEFADALTEAQEHATATLATERTPLIAYDGFEFMPFEFDQYTDEYDIPDALKHDVEEIHLNYPENPDADPYDDPYMQVLTPGAFFAVHGGDNREVVKILIYTTAALDELYDAIVNADSDAPTIDELADAGVEFHDKAFDDEYEL